MIEETATQIEIEEIKASYKRILAATTDTDTARVLRLALERLESEAQHGKEIDA